MSVSTVTSCIISFAYIFQNTRNFHFNLHGEIDKRGHPIFGDLLRKRNPDFVVHVPGGIGPQYNLATMEVKPVTSTPARLRKDAETITLLLNHVEYYRGIILLFGESERCLKKIITLGLKDYADRANQIHVYWHARVGKACKTNRLGLTGSLSR